MDFRLPEELRALRERVRAFVTDKIIPIESQAMEADARGDRSVLHELRRDARAEGLFVPHLPAAYGGLGLGVMGMCALFREMGRSPVGPYVFNCDAPDQGNMDVLLRFGSPEQRSTWLAPLAQGDITSAFCMTEPAPGAGADPFRGGRYERRESTKRHSRHHQRRRATRPRSRTDAQRRRRGGSARYADRRR